MAWPGGEAGCGADWRGLVPVYPRYVEWRVVASVTGRTNDSSKYDRSLCRAVFKQRSSAIRQCRSKNALVVVWNVD